MTSCIPQLSFSFYRQRSIRADFSGGQITSDAGLLPLRAFDQRHGLTRSLTECLCDDRDDSRVSHAGLSLLRQRLYQIIAGYEDANDADRLRHDPAFQILADQPLGEPLGSQPTLSRWENSPSPRDLLKLQDALLRKVKTTQRKPMGRSTTESDPLLCHQCAFRATILASDELTRVV